MIAVCNFTPLIRLAIIGHLDLLARLFDQVNCAEQVFEETAVAGRDRADAKSIRGGVSQGWLKVMSVPERFERLYRLLCMNLDSGEASTIALALDLKPDALIIDERFARIKAQGLELGPILTGTIGILARAKKKGFLPELKPVLDYLMATGFWINGALYRQVLEDAGEG